MTPTEFRQTIETLHNIVADAADSIDRGLLPMPVNMKRLDVAEFDRLGAQLQDLTYSPVPCDACMWVEGHSSACERYK